MTDAPNLGPRRRPRAFRLEAGEDRAEPRLAQAPERVTVEPQPDAYLREAESLLKSVPPFEAATEIAQAEGMKRPSRLTWGALAWSAFGGLVSLGFGFWVSRLIEDLFNRAVALGWIGVVLAALLIIALLALAAREFAGVLRQSHVAKLHQGLAVARLADDRGAARARVGELAKLYTGRAETARARAELAQASGEIIDGRDLIDIAERSLMLPLDKRVRREIAGAAKRVSMVTAISPRAVLDLVFVVAQLVRLVRQIAEIYSGRPGLLGFLKLARSVGAHLAVTGSMALGDSLVQQVVGHGIAARLSARLGEGVLNGLLTTRVGLSAMAVCRPMPFSIERPPSVKDVAPFLFSSQGGEQALPE